MVLIAVVELMIIVRLEQHVIVFKTYVPKISNVIVHKTEFVSRAYNAWKHKFQTCVFMSATIMSLVQNKDTATQDLFVRLLSLTQQLSINAGWILMKSVVPRCYSAATILIVFFSEFKAVEGVCKIPLAGQCNKYNDRCGNMLVC